MIKTYLILLMLSLSSITRATPEDALGQILVDKNDEALYVECLGTAEDGSCNKFSFIHHDPTKNGHRAFKILNGEGVTKEQLSKLAEEVQCRNKEIIGEYLAYTRQTVRDRQREYKTPFASVNLYRDGKKDKGEIGATILRTPLVFALEDVAFYTLAPILESGIYAVKSISAKIKSLRQKPLMERLLDTENKGVEKKIGRGRLRRLIGSLSDLLKFKACGTETPANPESPLVSE